jgi:hypothetical protein
MQTAASSASVRPDREPLLVDRDPTIGMAGPLGSFRRRLPEPDTASSTYCFPSQSCMWLEPSTTWKCLSVLAARANRSSLIHLLPATYAGTPLQAERASLLLL